jgi:hypothetical protein
MFVLESEKPCDEEHLTCEVDAWRAHFVRSLLLTCVHIGERVFHLETLS